MFRRRKSLHIGTDFGNDSDSSENTADTRSGLENGKFLLIGRVNMGEDVCKKIRLVDNILQAEDFIRLRIQIGFAEIPVDHARKALQNGLINVSAIYNGELVGMGRLVGDGAMYWYLQDIIILP